MRIKLFCFGALLFAITLNSCVKKSFNPEVVVPETDILNISASVYGRIIDEAGIPVAGATVKSPAATTFTNINGEFAFDSIALNDYAAYITASQIGYFNGARTFIARDGQKHYIEIQLMKKNVEAILNSTTGGTVTLTSGASLTLPANALKNQVTGAVYTGDAHVAISWIDPTATNYGRQIPGALRGINTSYKEMGLESYGMLGVVLTGNSGEILQLDSTHKATITFPLSIALRQNNPSSVLTLWSFNESTGFWNQEGTASQVGSSYVASVSHFSYWNCSAPYVGVHFTATVKDTRNNPLKRTLVRIKRVLNNTYIYTYTDTTGFVAALVPMSEPLVIEVLSSGTNPTVLNKNSGNIGPYSSVTADGGVVYVNVLGTYGNATITGKVVDCANRAIGSGMIYFNLRGLSYQAAVTAGAYSVSIPMSKSSDTLSYYVLDYSDKIISQINNATVFTGTNSFSNITVCSSGPRPSVPYKRFIYYYIDSAKTASVDSINTPSDSTSGYLVNNMNPKFTSIMGNISSTHNISFSFPGINNGSYNMTNLYINHPFLKNNTITNTNVTVNVTNYSSLIGGFISGSFYGSFISDTTHIIYGDFQVRRDY